MYKKISKATLKSKLLLEDEVEISLCSKKRSPEHILNAHLQVMLRDYSEFQGALDSYVRFCGKVEEPQICIWIEDEE